MLELKIFDKQILSYLVSKILISVRDFVIGKEQKKKTPLKNNIS